MSDPDKFADNNVVVTPGVIGYTDRDGHKQKFYFQCNPATLTRSRTASRTESKAANRNTATKTKDGAAGRKFTLDVAWWRIESFELWLDASNPMVIGSTKENVPTGADNVPGLKENEFPLPSGFKRDTSVKMKQALDYVMEGVRHLETICEPMEKARENETQSSFPPKPDPPRITLWYGTRAWSGYVTSLSILEKEFTPLLAPRLVKATLSMDLVPLQHKLDMRKTGGAA